MQSVKLIWKVCSYHFQRWKSNKRILLCFFLATILSFLLTEKVLDFSYSKNLSIQVLEPFIWIFGDGVSILLSSLILILLFADLPLLDGAVPYALMRINIFCWTLGQLLYMTISSVFYILFILASTMILSCQNAFIGNQWSPTAEVLSYGDYSEVLSLPSILKAAQTTHPYQCTFAICILMLLYILVSMFLMLYVSIKKGRTQGIISGFAFHIISFLLRSNIIGTVLKLDSKHEYIASILRGWLSPLSQVTFQMHNFGYDRLPRLKDTYMIFTVTIFLFVILTVKAMKKYNFVFIGTEKREGI